jgi:hypothetical protein
MKLLPLVSLVLFGCSLPPPPTPGSAGIEQPDASTGLSDDGDDTDEQERGVDAAPRADAEPRSRVLSQTTSSLIEPGTSIACTDEDGRHLDNSYYRVFDLASEGIGSSFHVTKVEVGVEIAESGEGTQPIEVLLHTVTGELETDNLTPLDTASQQVVNRVGGFLEFELDATVPSGGRFAVEVRVPDGRDDDSSFFIGANDDGQSAPGYIRDRGCGDEEPTDLADIGFPDTHLLIEVTGE